MIVCEYIMPVVIARVEPLPIPDIVTEPSSAPSEGSSRLEFNIEEEKYFFLIKLAKNYIFRKLFIFKSKI